MRIPNYCISMCLIFLIGCGFTTSNSSNEENKSDLYPTIEIDTTPRVTGIGGIFFKAKNPAEVNQWYGENLGLAIDPYGSPFEFRNANNPDEINYLRWSLFGENTGLISPSEKEFMINYRVHNIEGLVVKLQSNGIEMLDSIAEYDYGKFVHLMDPEGNKIELWEPIDSVFTNKGWKTTK